MADLRLLQLTDLHVFREPESTLKGIPTRDTLQEVVQWIQQHESQIDRLIITGDHTHDEHDDSYAAVRSLLEPWLDRLAIVPGNHDDRSVMRTVFGDVIAARCETTVADDDRITFSFHCGSWLCVGLDTHWPGEVAGHCGNPQIRWLRDRLAAHSPDPAIVFCHHPPVSVGSNWMDMIGLTDRDLLLDVFEEFASVRLVCCGHVHHEFTGQAGTAQVITSPSTGIQFDPAGNEPGFATDPPGYRVIELNGSDLETHVVRMPKARFTPEHD